MVEDPGTEARRQDERFGFWVRFVCGAIFGVVFGFYLWCRGAWQMDYGVLIIPATAFVMAILSALWGDDFYRCVSFLNFLGWLRWFGWWR